MMVLGIDWNVSSELIDGWSTPNKYGLLFVSGIILGYYVIKKVFKKENISDKVLDKLLMYIVIATVVGARLGHVLFYGPYWDVFTPDGILIERGYFSHPIDILKIYEGGLASHGGAIAIFIALFFFSKKVVQKPMFWILDRVAAPIAIAGCFIRLGNLVNHEIIGTPTSLPWGFKFLQEGDEYLINGEHVYRHPAQLYESLSYLGLFFLLRYLYWKKDVSQKPGFLFGVFILIMFFARFLIEFIKVGQTERDDSWMLNTGQLLSIPFILGGLYLMIKKNKKENNLM